MSPETETWRKLWLSAEARWTESEKERAIEEPFKDTDAQWRFSYEEKARLAAANRQAADTAKLRYEESLAREPKSPSLLGQLFTVAVVTSPAWGAYLAFRRRRG